MMILDTRTVLFPMKHLERVTCLGVRIPSCRFLSRTVTLRVLPPCGRGDASHKPQSLSVFAKRDQQLVSLWSGWQTPRPALHVGKSRSCWSVFASALIIMTRGKKRVEAGELQNASKLNLVFFVLTEDFSMKTEANLIYIFAHVCLSVASGGSLISCYWKDGFFKMSLWWKALAFAFVIQLYNRQASHVRGRAGTHFLTDCPQVRGQLST